MQIELFSQRNNNESKAPVNQTTSNKGYYKIMKVKNLLKHAQLSSRF